MKKRTIVMTVLVALLLASCVVKSLKPFYTKDTLAYDGTLVGKWEDEKLRVWEVVPMMKFLDSAFVKKEIDLDNQVIKGKKLKSVTEKIKKKKATVKIDGGFSLFDKTYKAQAPAAKIEGGGNSSLDSIKVDGKVTISKNKDFFEKKELQEVYNNAYLFIRKVKLSPEEAFFTKKKEVVKETYIVVPFQINGQTFLDFTPFEVEGLSDFVKKHLIGIHTLAKLDKKGESFELRWLSEARIEELFEQKKIRINHERIGIDRKDILLTASSEELQKFVAKYMDSEEGKDWGNVDLTLTRIK